jgi:hypothetical protein
MTTHALLLTTALLVSGGVAQAADAPARPHAKSTLAASASSQLRQSDVPSVKTDPKGADSVKAKADADLAARDARDKRPRLQVQRQNLKGADAARAIRQQTTPNSIDRATAYGDKDHTEQVTNLKVTVKK